MCKSPVTLRSSLGTDGCIDAQSVEITSSCLVMPVNVDEFVLKSRGRIQPASLSLQVRKAISDTLKKLEIVPNNAPARIYSRAAKQRQLCVRVGGGGGGSPEGGGLSIFRNVLKAKRKTSLLHTYETSCFAHRLSVYIASTFDVQMTKHALGNLLANAKATIPREGKGKGAAQRDGD